MFGGLGVGELVVIVLMLLLLFGAKRIPQIAKGLGEAIRNFKSDVKDPDRLSRGEKSQEEDAHRDESRRETDDERG